MKSFNLPDLGEGLDEAEIVEWHVAEGDRIIADQPLVSVETDKAVVEIPAPASGTVARIHVAAGDIAKVGAPLVDFEAVAREDRGTVVGALPTEEVESAEVRAARQVGKTSSVKAAPAVRALAQNLGLNIDDVSASGPGGSVTADDVKRAAKTLERAGPPEPLRGVRRAMARKMAHSHAEGVPASVFDEADISACLLKKN